MRVLKKAVALGLYTVFAVVLFTGENRAEPLEADDFEFVCLYHCQNEAKKQQAKNLEPVIAQHLLGVEKWFRKMNFGQTKYKKHRIILYDSTQNSAERKSLNICDDKETKKHVAHDRSKNSSDALGCYDSNNREIAIDFGHFQTAASLAGVPALVAHEMFHSVQHDDMPKWIGEATAEAVAMAYAKYVANSFIAPGSLKRWDANLTTENEDDEYRMHRFFLWAGQKIGSPYNVAYLKHFVNVLNEDDFDAALAASGAPTFDALLPEYIAQKHNDIVGYYATIDRSNGGAKLKKTDVEFTGAEQSEADSDFTVQDLSAFPNYFQAKYKQLPRDEVERLRVVEITIDEAEKITDLGFLYENLHGEYFRSYKIITKAEPDVNLGMTRVTNTNEISQNARPQNGKLKLVDQMVTLEAKTCVEPSETMEFTLAGLNKGFAFSEIANAEYAVLHPSKGKMLATDVWQAPTTSGDVDFDLEIKDYVKSDDGANSGKTKSVWIKNVFQASVANNCGIRMRLQSGETLTYDAEQDITQFKSRNDIMLMSDPLIYVFDPQDGWCTMNFDFVSSMMLGHAANTIEKRGGGIIDALNKTSAYMKAYDPVSSAELRKEAIDLARTEVLVTEGGNKTIKLPDQSVLLPAGDVKKDFDLYRIPLAVNEMLKLEKFQTAAKRIERGDLIPGGEIPLIELGKQPCRERASQSCHTVRFGERGKEYFMKILYNQKRKISRITVEGEKIDVDYGAFTSRKLPTHAKPCF